MIKVDDSMLTAQVICHRTEQRYEDVTVKENDGGGSRCVI
jgi:hypothetical protein